MAGRMLSARSLVFLAACLILTGGTLWLLSRFEANALWMREVELSTTSALDENTFQRLAAAGAFWPIRSETGVIVGHTPCNHLNVRAPEDAMMLEGRAGADKRKFIRELCETGDGQRIREAIAAFNRSSHLVAIRDTRFAPAEALGAAPLTCANGSRTSGIFAPRHCLPSLWTAQLPASGQRLSLVSALNIPVQDYIFLALRRRAYASDWSVAAPHMDHAEAKIVAFQSNLVFTQPVVAIHVVGAPERIRIQGATLELVAGKLEKTALEAGGRRFFVSAQTECATGAISQRETAVPCDGGTSAGRPVGAEILIETAPSAAPVEVEVEVLPRPVIPPTLRHARKGAEGTVSLALEPITLDCALDWTPLAEGGPAQGAEATKCHLSWTPFGEVETETDPENQALQIWAGQTPLLDANGDLTLEAFELGFGEFMGLGVGDPGSLASLYRAADGVDEVKLNLDPDMQRRALAALRNACPSTAPHCAADLVVMRASDEGAGEILAAAGRRRGDRGLSWWDILAIEAAAPGESIVAGHAWRIHDDRSTPGSAFKLVVALAAAQYALDHPDPDLEAILLGVSAADAQGKAMLAERLGIRSVTRPQGGPWVEGACRLARVGESGRSALPVMAPGAESSNYCIGNFRNRQTGIPASLESNYESGCRKGRDGAYLGLCEALQASSNLYFAGLALALDRSRLLSPESGQEHREAVPELALTRMAARLFPSVHDAVPNRERSIFEPLAADFVHSSRMRASPLKLAVEFPPAYADQSRSLILAQNGIGQSVDATPVAMASIAASIATRHIVRPHLIAAETRRAFAATPDPLEGQDLLLNDRAGLRDRFYRDIEEGMAAVVRRPGGTAEAAFRGSPLQGLIFAKSGTADVASREPDAKDRERGKNGNALWLVGYVQPPGGSSGIREKLAFACRLAYVDGTGSGRCGPIVRSFLEGLHAGSAVAP